MARRSAAPFTARSMPWLNSARGSCPSSWPWRRGFRCWRPSGCRSCCWRGGDCVSCGQRQSSLWKAGRQTKNRHPDGTALPLDYIRSSVAALASPPLHRAQRQPEVCGGADALVLLVGEADDVAAATQTRVVPGNHLPGERAWQVETVADVRIDLQAERVLGIRQARTQDLEVPPALVALRQVVGELFGFVAGLGIGTDLHHLQDQPR